MVTHDCTCQGYDQIYECRILGEGATIWKGTVLDCLATNNEILFLHSINSTSQRECNSGTVTGRLIHTDNNSYTSQLTVRVSSEVIGRNISCIHDSDGATNVIGSSLLNITTGIHMSEVLEEIVTSCQNACAVPYPPPNDVYLVEANSSQLIFQWSEIPVSCPAIQYRIIASNCGQCPNTTHNTTVTCTGTFPLLHDTQCLFALQTIVCDDIVGNVSMAVSVTMRGMYTYIVATVSGLFTCSA